jgi:threonine dehydrogenase-like Zn-dependent dehydrogenase
MPYGLYVDSREHVELRQYADAALADDQVRISVRFAAIKHGTLFHHFSGQSPFETRRFDPALRLFVPKAQPDDSAAMVGQFVGHMVSGTVQEIGPAVTRCRQGDRVFCYGPVCETVTRPESALYVLPQSMGDEDAVCVDPAFIGYTAMRDARVCIGDNVVVFGMGAIGLCIVQILRRAGCFNILAVDLLPKRRRLAEMLGASLALDPAAVDVAVELRRLLGHGPDVAIEASGHYPALAGALRAVRQCGRVVTLGYYRGKDNALELGAEWLHNRLELICSMPDWSNPSREHPLWDMDRLWATATNFLARGWLTSQGIVDPIVPFSDAARAFLDVYHDPSEAIKLGIRF